MRDSISDYVTFFFIAVIMLLSSLFMMGPIMIAAMRAR